MALPGLGTLTYGNLNLNGPAVRTNNVTARLRMDAAGRGRSWTEYTIGLTLTLAGGPTEAAVQQLRRTLNTPGLKLAYQDRGYGSLVLDGTQDAVYGPIPKEMGFRPLGGGNACEIDWQVTTAVPCEVSKANEIIEWVYTAHHDIDPAGYTTRRISVTIRIPGNRAGDGRGLRHTADEYRDRLAPPQIPGFRRTYPGWELDESKTVCRGEIVDEEMGANFPPEFVADLTADHEVSSANQGLALWSATVSADYEIVKGYKGPTTDAAKHFIGVIVRDRVAGIAQALGRNASTIVPISLRLREPEIFGRRKAAFSFTFTYTQFLADILGTTGLWRPVPGSNWSKWAASMQAGPANPRGYAGLEISPGDDNIVDGCGGADPGLFRNTPRVVAPPSGPSVVGGLPRPPLDPSLSGLVADLFPAPAAAGSWIFYECWVWVEVDASTIPVRPLPQKAPDRLLKAFGDNPFTPGIKGAFFDAMNLLGMPNLNPAAVGGGNRLENTPQQRAKPLLYVFLRGRAARYGFPIPIPTLNNFGGAVPVLATRLDRGEGYGHGIVRAASDLPVYGAVWNIRYQIPDPPAGFFPPAPANPTLIPKAK